jgi:hypothetical protein
MSVRVCVGVAYPAVAQSSQTELSSIRSEFLRTAVDRSAMIQSRIDAYMLCKSVTSCGTAAVPWVLSCHHRDAELR